MCEQSTLIFFVSEEEREANTCVSMVNSFYNCKRTGNHLILHMFGAAESDAALNTAAVCIIDRRSAGVCNAKLLFAAQQFALCAQLRSVH